MLLIAVRLAAVQRAEVISELSAQVAHGETSAATSAVRSLAKSCTTGHATNIIQGFAVGYESTVAAVLIIAGAILASVLVYADTNPTFIAFGVAMCGIGMLTLTGNTISMDVFGPVADNANVSGRALNRRVEIFLRERVYMRYAKRFLTPDQIDRIDWSKIPGISTELAEQLTAADGGRR